MDLFLLTLHNLTRWLVLLAAVYALYRMLRGVIGRQSFTGSDATAGRAFTGLMDLQLLLGLALYFVGPTMQQVYRVGFGAAMRDSGLRFFAAEHTTVMLAAVVFAHLGTALIKRQSQSAAKFRVGATWYAMSLLSMLLLTPWGQRPLLRLMSLTVGA